MKIRGMKKNPCLESVNNRAGMAFPTGVFKGMTRDDKPLKKSFNGAFEEMFSTVKLPN
jgi:hypothetical protein